MVKNNKNILKIKRMYKKKNSKSKSLLNLILIIIGIQSVNDYFISSKHRGCPGVCPDESQVNFGNREKRGEAKGDKRREKEIGREGERERGGE
jgi:hypothetical protein